MLRRCCNRTTLASTSGIAHAPTITIVRRDEVNNNIASAETAKPIHEARDVRVARDHPLGDVPARQPRRVAATKNAQDVVLVGGEAGRGLEKLVPRLGDARGRDPDAQQDLLLPRGERALLFQFTGNAASHG